MQVSPMAQETNVRLFHLLCTLLTVTGVSLKLFGPDDISCSIWKLTEKEARALCELFFKIASVDQEERPEGAC